MLKTNYNRFKNRGYSLNDIVSLSQESFILIVFYVDSIGEVTIKSK